MSETYGDMWREEEQEDSCSSCSSYLYLESSNDTEIITVPAEHVPLEHSEVDRMFLMERLLLAAYRLDMENMLRYVQVAQQDGGALGSGAVQYADDTVDTQAPDTQDTVPNTDTDTDKDQDIDINQTQDSHDTSARH